MKIVHAKRAKLLFSLINMQICDIKKEIINKEIKMVSEMENVPECFVFSSKDPTCCERLHTSANIAQQETTLLGPTMLRVVASVCTGLKSTQLKIKKSEIKLE